MEEIWKDVPDFSGYQVSNLGRVKTLTRKVWNPANGSYSLIKGGIMKEDCVGKVYAQINLRKNGKYKKFLLHRLVAWVFIPNPDNLPEVNHKNCNKRDNRSDNLEWATRLTNAQHANRNGRYGNMPRGERRVNHILTVDAVRHIREKSMRNSEYCKLYGVKPPTVTMIQRDQNRWKDVVL